MTRLPGIRALGLDPGSKRIGVAVSDLSGTIASPLHVLQRSKSTQHDLHEIAKLAAFEEAEVIVIGLPLNMDGSLGPSAKSAKKMAVALGKVTAIPVEMYDERRTTATADDSMMNSGLNALERRQRVDKVAAAIMLQSWLEARKHRLTREATQGS